MNSTGSEPSGKEIDAFTDAIFRKVIVLRKDDELSNFVVASKLASRGMTAEALPTMQRLAPADRKGFVQAHIWMAQFLLTRDDPRDALALKHHLRIAVESPDVSAEMLAVAAKQAARVSNLRQALTLFARAAERNPTFQYELFDLAIATENEVIAESTATAAIPRLEKLLKGGKATIRDQIALGTFYLYKGKVDAAIETLQRAENQVGLTAEETAAVKRARSQMFCALFVDSQTFDGKWNGRIEYLNMAFHADPTNPYVAETIAKLSTLDGPEPPDALIAQLESFLVSGKATAITHVWLAESRIRRKEYRMAIQHLRQAIRREPMALFCHNNLAYALWLQDENVDEALKHAEIAASNAPNEPAFQDTLGVILMKLKRPTDAVKAFEDAIKVVSQANYHRHAAEAYTAIGMLELAKKHQALAAASEDK
ncbi:MAG: hypothetical protein AAF483_28635 [Planctomycetota bacterium]